MWKTSCGHEVDNLDTRIICRLANFYIDQWMLSPPHLLWIISRNCHFLTFWLIDTGSNILVIMRIETIFHWKWLFCRWGCRFVMVLMTLIENAFGWNWITFRMIWHKVQLHLSIHRQYCRFPILRHHHHHHHHLSTLCQCHITNVHLFLTWVWPLFEQC